MADIHFHLIPDSAFWLQEAHGVEHLSHLNGVEMDGIHLIHPDEDAHEDEGGDSDEDAEDEPIIFGEDEPKPAQRTSVIEQCLAYGSEERLRLQLTLSVTGAAWWSVAERPFAACQTPDVCRPLFQA